MINFNVFEFHTLNVLSLEQETIFSFEGIRAKAETPLVCPFKVAINWNVDEFHTCA